MKGFTIVEMMPNNESIDDFNFSVFCLHPEVPRSSPQQKEKKRKERKKQTNKQTKRKVHLFFTSHIPNLIERGCYLSLLLNPSRGPSHREQRRDTNSPATCDEGGIP